jgi:hypothetical protein
LPGLYSIRARRSKFTFTEAETRVDVLGAHHPSIILHPLHARLTVYHEAINQAQKRFKEDEMQAVEGLIKKDLAVYTKAERDYLTQLFEFRHKMRRRLLGPFGLK